MPPELPSTDEVEAFVDRLLRATPRLNPYAEDSPLLDRAGVIAIVRAYRGDAAAEHAAKILRLH